MDWSATTFDWNRARAFLVTAEEGSLSAAARALGLAQPTVGRQVEAFQDELGVVLFERAGHSLTLTPAGHALLDHARAMGEAAIGLSRVAYGQNDEIDGRVTIAASDAYAGILLPPILERLQAQEPRISVSIVVSNDAADLLRREADIAIRNFQPKEPDLIAKRLRTAHARFYASPDYVDALGEVTKPGELGSARFIGLDDTGLMLGMLQQLGFPITDDNIPLRTGNFLVMWALVKRGLGIGVLDDRIGDNDPDVVRVLPDMPPLEFPLFLVAHRDIHQSRRLRFVWDFLSVALR
ncbi:LysR family transcriptional regulator [Maritimibacter dapengensis]|nr:LysR family transcriptional regulator [Maritimibacter dapengensis]